ncbi:restriction endonuclease subunit S [Acidovorax sp. Be4]|uniref:Restriction endonuclease subunit S n=1 Tax=Acidovorax bellezanensis TaxID=2976702 RepID=A0ABT2PH68_9BURK|nr:restriction endonuclease subunit S [Acidovorax sp. Be4]MCT9809788.1 restriction endonuclease subunit S [Acidovorax sp. Be4]
MLLSNLDLLATALGGVTRLRELILTLAVQGKLVPQDPADEPAGELLQKIRTEKDRLIAEGKIKRDKPLTRIAEEEKPFELPKGWAFCRLGELLLSIRSGGTPSKQNPDFWGGSIPWASVKDLYFGEPISDTQDRITQAGLDAGSELAPAGSILICTRMGLGKIGEALIDVAINQDLKAVLLGVGVDKQYFINYFKTLAVVGSGMTVAGIKQDELLGFVVPLPPSTEQSRIVTRVEELMRLCDALETKGQLEATQHAQLVSTLLGTLTASASPEELADNWQRVAQHFDLLLDRPQTIDALEQTLLQLAVRGLLVPQDPTDEPASALLACIRTEKDRLIDEGKIKRDKPLPPITDEEKPFELPVGWEWVRFGQIASIASKLVPPALHAKKWQVAPDCIEKGTGRLLERRTVAQAEIISPNHLFKPGQILYSKIRPSLSKAVLVDFEGLCSADMYPIESPLDSQYLLMYILSQPFLDQVSVAENRVKMPKLNQEALVAFTVALPPLAEQSRIVTRVTALRRLCADLRQRLAERQSVQARLAEALVHEVASA